ncbi:MAG: hypothetical protein HQM12_21880, partial [SAR324 cluster bacterium]|nr:hypothetical protein [SAR324 cluster bacterium]
TPERQSPDMEPLPGEPFHEDSSLTGSLPASDAVTGSSTDLSGTEAGESHDLTGTPETPLEIPVIPAIEPTVAEPPPLPAKQWYFLAGAGLQATRDYATTNQLSFGVGRLLNYKDLPTGVELFLSSAIPAPRQTLTKSGISAVMEKQIQILEFYGNYRFQVATGLHFQIATGPTVVKTEIKAVDYDSALVKPENISATTVGWGAGISAEYGFTSSFHGGFSLHQPNSTITRLSLVGAWWF